jgi:hypothetical protein
MKSPQERAESRNPHPTVRFCWLRGAGWKAWAMDMEMTMAIERMGPSVHVSSARYATFYALPHEIPCNLARRFPLYGVEADGLPLRLARREEENRAAEP